MRNGTCPRCGAAVRPPGVWSNDWLCETHGAVHPFHAAGTPSRAVLQDVVDRARVPVWVPWPLPPAWLVTGVCHAGDERTGARAVGVACSGPAPLGGGGDLVLVAEEPGVGLGARLAGLDGPDPGDGLTAGPAAAKVHADGRPTALWPMPNADSAAVYAGEAAGAWLWVLLWPPETGWLLAEPEPLELIDLRAPALDPDLPFGARSPRLPTA